MKKKYLLYMLIPIICIICVGAYLSNSALNGDTLESREALLNHAIAKGNEWTIAKEIEIDGYIISGAYSANGKSTIAVFEPTSNKKYKFSSSTTRDSEEIILGRAFINGEWYDLFWFNGAQTEYAEIIYTVNGEKSEVSKYDTIDMNLIYAKSPEKDYSIEVCYYDSDGNRYE